MILDIDSTVARNDIFYPFIYKLCTDTCFVPNVVEILPQSRPMSRDRVVPKSPTRPTPQYPAHSQKYPAPKTVFFNCLGGVFAACWNKSARCASANKWRNTGLVHAHQSNCRAHRNTIFLIFHVFVLYSATFCVQRHAHLGVWRPVCQNVR